MKTGRQQFKPHYGPVRITIPAKVAFDLDSLQTGIEDLVGRLGSCPCFSGADCTFLHERDFIIDEKLKAIPQSAALPFNAQTQGHAVTVTLDREQSYDINKVKDVVAKVVGLLGCEGCHSGFDITFRQEWEQQLGHQFNARILKF